MRPTADTTRRGVLRWTCRAVVCAALAASAVAAPAQDRTAPDDPAPTAQAEDRPTPATLPAARWDFRPEAETWSKAAIGALKDHGDPLVAHVPRDIGSWCPGYARAPDAARRAFWVGFLSALAKHESTWRPGAVGGGGRWFGLLQIKPDTAKAYGCRARSGAALRDGAANLRCGIRIMAETVTRDGVIQAGEPDWGGVAADWGPLRNPEKRRDMVTWLRRQPYCQMQSSPRPLGRPETVTMARPDGQESSTSASSGAEDSGP